MITTQHGKTWGSQNPQLLVHCVETDADAKLVDAFVIRCTPEQEESFMFAVSDEMNKKANAEAWVLANR
jgi:hypothetical protein